MLFNELLSRVDVITFKTISFFLHRMNFILKDQCDRFSRVHQGETMVTVKQ